MRVVALACAAGLAAGAGVRGQSTFTNADFETGDLSGWTVRNTANGVGAPGSVTMVDIDGPGPLGESQAATFMVGQVTFMSGVQEGVEVTQVLSLTAGTEYTFEFDWSAQRLSPTNNAEGGVFSLIVAGVVVAMEAAGDTSSTQPRYGHVRGAFTPSTSGNYSVGIQITRPYMVPGDLFQYVDNVRSAGSGPAPCYPDCTGDHALNVNDFVCFQAAFAGGNMALADCNHDQALNVNDFVCFQSAFAAGCSAP